MVAGGMNGGRGCSRSRSLSERQGAASKHFARRQAGSNAPLLSAPLGSALLCSFTSCGAAGRKEEKAGCVDVNVDAAAQPGPARTAALPGCKLQRAPATPKHPEED